MKKEPRTFRKFGPLAFATVLILASVGINRAADPKPVTFDLTNETGMSGSQIWVQFLGGQPVAGTYTDYTGATQQLYANTAYSLDQLANSAGSSTLSIDNFSGRIYVNYGAYGLQGMENTSYTPAAATPNDPNYGTRYQYFEATIISNAGNTGGRTVFADLSYIDFTAISFSMQAVNSSGALYNGISNNNQKSANGQALINQALSSALIPGQAVLPIGSGSTGSNFARVISPQYTVDTGDGAVYPSFQPYLDAMEGKTFTIAGTFVGTQPENTAQTVQQAYYYTGSFSGTGTTGSLVLISNEAVTGRTDYSWMPQGGATGISGTNTITISYTDLVNATGIYGNNPNYTVTETTSGSLIFTSTVGITNDVYGRVVGDMLAGISLGYIGSTVTGTVPTVTSFSGSTSYGASTAFGDMPSSLWWASGQAQTGTTYIPLADGSDYLAVTWDDTPAKYNYIFSAASGSTSGYIAYNAYAAALALNQSGTGYGTNPYTTGYGFPLQDRMGNNLLSYSTDQYADAIIKITVNPDGSDPLATGIWTGTASGTSSWLTASNWSGSTAPLDGASAQFVGGPGITTVQTGTNLNLTGIYFNYRAGTFIIEDNTINLSGNIVNSSTNTQTINSDLALGPVSTIFAAFGDLVIGGDMALGATGTATVLTFNGTANTLVSGAISGDGSLTKLGSGGLTLSGSNSFSGGTFLQEGTLTIANDYAFGTGTVTMGSYTSSNVVLQVANGDHDIANDVILNGNLAITGTSGVTFNGSAQIVPLVVTSGTVTTITGPTITNTTDVTFNGVIGESLAGSDFTKAGNGTMTFGGSSANTFTGNLGVNDGTLILAKTSGTAFRGNLTIGDGTGAADSAVVKWNASEQGAGLQNSGSAVTAPQITVNTDGRADLQNYNETVGTLTMYGGKVVGTGTLSVVGTNSGSVPNPGMVEFLGTGSSSAVIEANLALGTSGSGAPATFNVAKSSAPVNLSVTGAVTGTSAAKSGGGVLALHNNQVNGDFYVTQGILQTSSATNANFLLSSGGLGALSSGTTTQTVDIKSLAVSNTGALLLGLGAGTSDTLNITEASSGSVDIADDTIFIFRDAGMVASGSTYTFSLVTGASGAWSGTPSTLVTSLTHLSADISGLVGSFAFNSGTLTFTGTAGVSATWSASAGSSDWSTGGNWDGGQAPSSGANLIFGQTTSATVDTGTSMRSAGSLTFTSTASAYTITGTSPIIVSGDILNSSSETQTFESTVIINGEREVNAAAGDLVFEDVALSVSAALPGRLSFTGSGNTTVNGTISDGYTGSEVSPTMAAGGEIAMNGTGTLTLSGSNSFQGDMSFNSGVVAINDMSALGNLVTFRNFNFNGGTLEIDGSGTFSQIQNVNFYEDAIFVVKSGSLVMETQLKGDGGLVKDGDGLLSLVFVSATTPNTYTGTTTIRKGILNVDYAESLGSTVAGTVVHDGGTLRLDTTESQLVITGESLRVSGSGHQGGGALQVQSGSAGWAGTVTAFGDATIQAAAGAQLGITGVVDAGTGNLTLQSLYDSSEGTFGQINIVGSLIGSGTLTATGGGLVTLAGLSGTNAGFSGVAIVEESTVLQVAANTALGTGSSSVIVQDGGSLQFASQSQGGMLLNFGQITLSGSGVTKTSVVSPGAINNNTVALTTLAGAIEVADDALIYVANGALQATGNINLNGNTLTIQSEVGQTILTGTISGGGNIATINEGNLTLAGNSTYSGTTTIGNGTTITAASSTALGTSYVSVGADGSAALLLSGSNLNLGNDMYLSGDGFNSQGALVNVSGTNTVSGTLDLNGTVTIGALAGQINVSGTLTNGTTLVTVGPGTVNYTGTSASLNAVNVSSGTFASGSMSEVNLTLESGSAAYSPGGNNNIETVLINNIIVNGGSLLLDISGTTSDLIQTEVGPAFNGPVALVLNEIDSYENNFQYLIVNSPNGGIGGSGVDIASISGIANATFSSTSTAGSPGEIYLTITEGASQWKNEAGDGQWGTGSNWQTPDGGSGGFAPLNGSAVSFTGTAAGTTIVQTGVDRMVGGLAFSASSQQLNITGNTISAYGDIVNQSSVQQQISSNVNVTGHVTANAADGGLVLSGTVHLGADRSLTVTGSHTTTISGPITGGSAGSVVLLKNGSGILAITGSSNYAGITGINDGVVILDGSIESDVVIGVNGTLAGTGTAGGVVIVAGTLEPGHSPGNLTTGAQAWLENGNYNWQLLDASLSGVAGVDYDLVTIEGQLNLTGLIDGDFNINLWTLSDPNTSGEALNFNNQVNQSWTLATTTNGIVGFNADHFAIHTGAFNGTGGFANALAGNFSVSVVGNDLMLNYTVIPEPSAMLLLTGSLLALAARSRRRMRK